MRLTEIMFGLCVTGVLATGAALVVIPCHRIEKASIAMIRPGMDQRQVEVVLGAIPGDYGPECVMASHEMTTVAVSPYWDKVQKHWVADEVVVTVAFGDDGKVIAVDDYPRENWKYDVGRVVVASSSTSHLGSLTCDLRGSWESPI